MNKKILTIVGAAFCAVLLVAGSIMGTLAYLTDTKTVTNTFTVGKVSITLTESPVDANGKKTTGTRVYANNYHLVPGTTYDKDPLITVAANSEASYIFVKVENGLSALEAAGESSIVAQLENGGWKLLTEYVADYNDGKADGEKIPTPTTNAENVYVYCKSKNAPNPVVAKSDTNVEIQVFNTFSLASTADLSTLDDTDDDGTIDATIEVTAYAVQATGLANPSLAWNTAFGNAN